MNSPQEKAQMGLRYIEQAMIDLLGQHAEGLTNTQIAKELGIETGEPGEHRNMLSWSILGKLTRSGRIERVKAGRGVVLRIAPA